MKRPLSFVGFSMLITLLLLTVFDSQVLLLCVSLCSVAVFMFSVIHKNTRKALYLPFISFAVLSACLLLYLSADSYHKATQFTNNNCTVRAVLKQTPYFSKENNRYYSEGKIVTLNGKIINSNIKLSFTDDPCLKADDEILFDGYIYKTGSGIHDIENHYKSDKLYLGCYSMNNLKVTKSNFKGYYFYTEKIKQYVSDVLLKHLDKDTAGLLISLLTGDKSYLDDEIYINFQRSGVSHLMAVSGMHLSVWVMFFGVVLSKKSEHRFIPNLTLIFIVVLIMILAGFSGSVKRAGFMCVLHLIGRMLSKQSDSLNSLGFSVCMILILNPYSVYDIGFLLSFLSTLAIVIVAMPVSDKITGTFKYRYTAPIIIVILEPVIKSICISLSVAIFTLPVIAEKFGYISTVSVLTNLLFLPVTFVLILSAGLLVVLNPIRHLCLFLAFICTLLSRYSLSVTAFMAKFRYSCIPSSKEIILCWFIFIAVSLFLFVYKNKNIQIIKIAAVSVCIVCSLVFAVSFSKNLTSYKLYLIPADGKFSVLVSMNSQGVLVGYHDSYYFEENVLDIAQKNNIRISAVISDENKKVKNFVNKNKTGILVSDNNTCLKLMNTVEICRNSNIVQITGNGKTFYLVNKEYLQQNDECDIIVYSCFGFVPADSRTSIKNYLVDGNTKGYIQIYSNGKYKTGGELIG